MSASAAPKKVWTAEEYLQMERTSDERHDFFRGEVFAMAGASRAHNTIVLNIGAELRSALRGRPCAAWVSDMRLRIAAADLYTYPDVTALCGPAEFEAPGQDSLLNPQVIFEVLSESPRATNNSYDRGKKFELYRTIPSVAEVVLVSQKEPLAEHFVRHGDGSWRLREYRAGQRLTLESLRCDLAVDEIYLSAFEPPAAA